MIKYIVESFMFHFILNTERFITCPSRTPLKQSLVCHSGWNTRVLRPASWLHAHTHPMPWKMSKAPALSTSATSEAWGWESCAKNPSTRGTS